MQDVSVMWLPCGLTSYVDVKKYGCASKPTSMSIGLSIHHAGTWCSRGNQLTKEEDDIDPIKEAENERNDVEVDHEVVYNKFEELFILRLADHEVVYNKFEELLILREELYGVNDGDVRGIFDKNVEFKAGVDINNEETEDMLHGVDDEAVEEKVGIIMI
ncbi:hypothetical protein Bca4012_009781 [Brassica carinata]